MPDDSIPGPTPTGYQRTRGGGVKWVPPTAEHLSNLLPQYDIESILGYGGMGAVYKGKQKSLDRTVAIKILPPGLEDEDASYVDRFKNEARIMAKLDHPAIVPVYDFGETTEGQLYIVMAFVDGTDVQKMLHAQGRLPSEHALAITAHVCDALKYAHEHGVIHRDIKPANILINMEGAVKVADFGLAKAEEHGSSGITKSGMAMGTPDYVAPEALIMGVNVDGRADLYAVGVMLYAMLTGNVPRGAFKPASVMIREIDPRFDHIVQRAMQMDREERYQTAAEIRRDLDVILTTPLVQAGGQSSAAIPKATVAQKPVAKGPQKPMGKSANVPVRQGAAAADLKSEIADRKSKTPLLIGIGAVVAIAVGAFVMFSGGRADGPPSAAPSQTALGGPSAPPNAPIKVREDPKPALAAPISNPKSTISNTAASTPTDQTLASSATIGSAPKPETPKPAPEKKEEPKPVATAPAPSISASPSLPVSKSSDKFPPGQWVKVFTKFEDLPEDMRKPDSGVKVEDGWISHRESKTISFNLTASFRNSGIRARVVHNTPTAAALLSVRSGATDNIGCYQIGYNQFGKACQIQTVDRTKNANGWHRSASSLAALDKTGEAMLEIVALENHIFYRMDGRLFGKVEASSIGGGISGYYGSCPIRDIEVINLDGIPEAEALRILGVDEKGNDTRAAALAAEKLAIEQKQVAQAAASIPELATLDEQLKKLTAERVSAPFEAEVAKLNSGYLGGLDRKRAEEKAAGHLDSVLAIEAEKKLIVTGGSAPASGAAGAQPPITAMPIPTAEDDATSTTTPAVLKGLRQIYREAYAKIEATRAANLKALTDPLTTRLRTLESDLTKKDRIADAKTVKEYREGLGGRADGPPSAVAGPQTALGGPSALPPSALPMNALKDGFTNSLGMKFVPVKGTDVLFCIHETRYKDYAAYAAEAVGVNADWKDQTVDGFMLTENKEDHPVIKVSWEDGQKFCTWLSKKEGKTYRLPTDKEWSYAVGIGRDEKWKADTTPISIVKSSTEFPWGDKWPPPKGTGNFSDQSRKEKAPNGKATYIERYDDGFPTTAPVMSFKANKPGLYDMGGNVVEWVEDWYDNGKKDRVLRDASFAQGDHSSLLSSNRRHMEPGHRFPDPPHGFRCVVDIRSPATKGGEAPEPAPPPPTVVPPPAPATAAKSEFSNSLGMKFVKVPGTQVMFCIHETRRQDYAAYAAEVPDLNGLWKVVTSSGIPVSHKDDHPVGGVSWDHAQSFCGWLSKKEGRKYRLPTDKEWSYAVGIGREEKWTKDTTPETLSGGLPNEFPWGGDFPPKTKDQAGNYGDMILHEILPEKPFIEGYTDGFATTAPVMSFKPNKLGIYDLGGNVWEWCEDWSDNRQRLRVLRGGGWGDAENQRLRSSSRNANLPDNNTGGSFGFRIVVEMTAP